MSFLRERGLSTAQMALGRIKMCFMWFYGALLMIRCVAAVFFLIAFMVGFIDK